MPEPEKTADLWRREAERSGLKGLFLVRVESHNESGDPRKLGYDYSLEFQPYWPHVCFWRIFRRKWWHVRRLGTHEPGLRENNVFDYGLLVKNALAAPVPVYPRIPCVCPGWDNSPRKKRDAHILINSTPELYGLWLSQVVSRMEPSKSSDISADSLVFINAWNEWAEGNHLEPCQKWGHKYLEATRLALRTPLKQGIEYAGR